MHRLTDAQKETIQFLQRKVEKYQVKTWLCASLTSEQCRRLAELQVIYNNLSSHTLFNHSAIFNISCKGVKDRMNEFNAMYSNKTPEELYCAYVEKYKEAKTNPDETKRLDKLLNISSSDDCKTIISHSTD